MRAEQGGEKQSARMIHFPPPRGAASKREKEETLDWIVFSLVRGTSQSECVFLPETLPLPRGNFWWREKLGGFRARAGSPKTIRGVLEDLVPS